MAGASRWFSIPQPHGLWVAHGDPSKRTGCGQLALVAPEHKVSTRAAEALPCVGSAQERCRAIVSTCGNWAPARSPEG